MTRTFLDAGVPLLLRSGHNLDRCRSDLLEEADDVASRFSLVALDALHVTSAMIAGADELVTTERPTRPIHRVSGLSVKTIYL